MILDNRERSVLAAIYEGASPRHPDALYRLFEKDLVGWDDHGAYRITRAGRAALGL